jgi:hypothetical protein
MLGKKYLLYTLMQIAIKMNKNLSAFIVGISSILLLAAGVEVITFQTAFAQTTNPTIQSDINATAALSTILGEPFFIDRDWNQSFKYQRSCSDRRLLYC